MLEPVFAHVINFSCKKKWDWPMALKDKDETIAYLIQKYGMTKDDVRATTQQYWMHNA